MQTHSYLKSILFSLTALAAVLCITGCKQNQEQAPAARPAPIVSFITIAAQKAVLSTELPGRTTAFRLAEIRPQVNGLVQERLFEEGSDVEAGQVLYRIDPAPFNAAMDAARARLGAARKAADRLEAALNISHAGIARQQATLELAKINAERYQKLVRSNSVSAIQRDQAVTELKVAEASLKTAQAQLESDRQAIEAAKADIEQARAALNSARINLSYCDVTSPFSGRIGRSSVTEGAIVTAYQPMALASIQQFDPVYVDVPQSTTELLRLKRRMKAGAIQADETNPNQVSLTLEDGTAYPHPGTLKFSDVTVDPTTGSVTLRILFPNPEDLLLPGMFVRATIKEGISETAILIPQQGVSRDHKGNPYAMVVEKDGKAGFRPLALDRAIGSQWLISSGLKAGDKLIVEGLMMLRPGTPVTAKPFAPAAKADPAETKKEGDA